MSALPALSRSKRTTHLLDRDLEGFQQRVKHAFGACRQAVQEQLAAEMNPGNNNGTTAPATGNGAAGSNGNGANGNGSCANGGSAPMATVSPTAATAMPPRRSKLAMPGSWPDKSTAWAFAAWTPSRKKLYGMPLAALASDSASGLIDTLRDIKLGLIELSSVWDGVGT